MRPAALILILFLGLVPMTQALGSLVVPSGKTLALGEADGPGGPTFLFPAHAVKVPSWVVFPPGTVVSEVVIVTPTGRVALEFPEFKGPVVRFAVEVPVRILALTVRGRWTGPSTLVLSETRPEVPGQAWVTRSAGELVFTLPQWTVPGGCTPVLTLTRPAQATWKAKVTGSAGSKSFTFNQDVLRWDFAPGAWGFNPGRVEISGTDPRVLEIKARAVGPTAALPADPTAILAWPREAWRTQDREWFTWEGTSVLVLVSATYKVQEAYLKRLAFFIEKTGFRGRLVPDSEIATLHGWNAHDYSAPDLARFFTKAAQEAFPLHPEELELRTWLETAGVIVAKGTDSWTPGTGALVGISHESPPALRSVLFVHEAFHGLYYTNPEFRAGVKTAWDALADGSRRVFRAFLALSDYDPTDEALMVNEFQSYVLQRPSTEWIPFFKDRVHAGPWLSDLLGGAKTVEALVNRLYALDSGTVSRVKVF